jgi:colanic acid biosynthesis glycosyl transferase WcaI
MRSLVFTEQFYYPEGWGGAQVPRDITTHLADAGFDVSVVCGSEQYAPMEGSSSPDPSSHGVRIVRMPRLFSGDIHTRKLLRQLWFYAVSTPVLLVRARPELYVSQTNPPLMVPIVAAIARLRGVPMMIIAQDLYPEVMIAHGMVRSGSFTEKALNKVFGAAYKSASRVVALGSTMAERLREKGVDPHRVTIISNWASGDERVVRGDDNLLRREWGLEGKFVILYSGNVGIAHDIQTPIRAVAELGQARPNVRLVIVGKGQRLQEAKDLVRELGVEDYVQFRPLVPTEMLPHSIGLADVALVTLGQDFAGLVVPSKLLGYMARGIPTAYIGPPSDVVTMLAESGGGRCFEPGDVSGLASAFATYVDDPGVLAAVGEAARAYYASHLAREVALERYAELVEHVARRHEPPPLPEARA